MADGTGGGGADLICIGKCGLLPRGVLWKNSSFWESEVPDL